MAFRLFKQFRAEGLAGHLVEDGCKSIDSRETVGIFLENFAVV
jgi:hypothetical protein